ncbi:hypothetical protein Ab1vBOLIVR4_gp129 [Agrobacterium phage OLIVR4]|nr:hypothetical protein Ab1vBOLIVR4_gp129 [Agrobacterium phage OLIVR4]
MKIEFRPWKRFYASQDQRVIQRFLSEAADVVLKRLRDGLRNPPKTGKFYTGRSKRRIQASVNRALAEYPARDTGDLLRSAKRRVGRDEMEVGTGMFYSNFLRDGTSKMARRKMSDTSMEESLPKLEGKIGRFAYWKRG